MLKVDPIATPWTTLAGRRWRGSVARLYRRGVRAEHAMPKSITFFLPRRSDIEPSGMESRTVVSPVDEAITPMRATDAPRLLAKKG